MSAVRTRFAPSPTGSLHVGSVRTAIFAWLLARQDNGQFLLRIEDTDRERLVDGAVQSILEDLAWFGIEPDEAPSLAELQQADFYWPEAKTYGGNDGPYIQSLRLTKYQAAAETLVESGFAYRCDCSAERLDQERKEQQARKVPPGYSGYCRDRNVSKDAKHVIRFRIPTDTTIELDDLVKGKITWNSPALRDTVILKSDGFPTYHLAVVVDDNAMRITHVLRGEEWIPTTPIHILLYKALGFTAPKFAHLPNVLGQDGKKLSKRHGATTIVSFEEQGYLPEALLNFLTLIGWAPGEGDEQEIFTKDELIAKFSLGHVNRAAAVFSFEKLNWMNGMYIRSMPNDELVKRIRPHLEQAGFTIDDALLTAITPHIKERMTVLTEAPSLVEFLFNPQLEPDIAAMMQKNVDAAKATEILSAVRAELSTAESFVLTSIEALLKRVAEKLSLNPGVVMLTTRIAVTGRKATPPLLESIEVLGRARSLSNIDRALVMLSQHATA